MFPNSFDDALCKVSITHFKLLSLSFLRQFSFSWKLRRPRMWRTPSRLCDATICDTPISVTFENVTFFSLGNSSNERRDSENEDEDSWLTWRTEFDIKNCKKKSMIVRFIQGRYFIYNKRRFMLSLWTGPKVIELTEW